MLTTQKYIQCSIGFIVIIKIFSTIAIAGSLEFIAGEHFKILRTVEATKHEAAHLLPENMALNNHPKPQVMMFFNYGCYGCWLVNKDFRGWMRSHRKSIDAYYYPVVLNNVWESFAKMYYVNQELLPNDDGEEIFVGFHQDHKKLWLEAEMIKFYEKKNISKEHFLKIYHSFDVERKVKKAIEITKMYNVRVTPNVIVNVEKNSYMINFTMIPNVETLFKVIDYLIKEHPSA